MATIDVKDAAGATVAVEKPIVPGRAAAAASRPVALSSEDFAVVDGLETAIASTNTKLDTLAGHVDTLETLIASTNTKLDTAITALQIIDNMVLAAGTANIGDVDVLTLPALVAGTAAIGKLAANSGVDIGDVDVLTIAGVSPAFGSGAAGATVLRTVLTTDSPGITALGQAVKSSSLPVTMASDQEPAHDAVDSGNPIKLGGYASAAAPTDVSANADRTNAWFLRNGALATSPQPHTAGGFATPFRSLDLDETEEDVKTSPGCLYKLRITNRATTARYVKLYNDTAANVIVGTTAPIDTIVVPAAGSADLATVITENFGGYGLPFSVALALAATTGLADNDTGAPATNDVVVSAYYK